MKTIIPIVCVVAIALMLLLTLNIGERIEEQEILAAKPPVAAEDAYRNESYSRYYPRQYGSWDSTRQSDHIEDMLETKPQLSVLWAGYGFSKDYNAPRGHRYALGDNVNTLRTGAPVDSVTGPMPTACWTCKSPDVGRLIERDGEKEYYTGKWAKYGTEVANPIGCADCHDPENMELSVGRQFVDRALEAMGKPTFAESSHQERRSLVCAQCHSEYYFHKTPWTDEAGVEKTAGIVTFPWANGWDALEVEEYYDDMGFKDWTHKISKAPMLKAQHPGYEMYKTGVHGMKGVACADCHMPYTQEGAVKYSDHQVGSPLKSMDRSCMPCHRESEDRLTAFIMEKFERKETLMTIAMDNLAAGHLEAGKAWEVGATEEEMAPVLQHLRHGQWRWDYSIASHGSWFHAPDETLRLLSLANEEAMQARLKLVAILHAHGVVGYVAPDFDTKEQAQELAGVPLEELVAAKREFKATLEREWQQVAATNGVLDLSSRDGLDLDKASYYPPPPAPATPE